MATLNSAKRNTSAQLDAGDKILTRNVEFILDLAADTVMTTATDDINLATLAGGTVVLSVQVQQLVAGTGTGTLVGRVGTTTATGTLASTAAAGTWAAPLPAVLPLVVPAAGAELNLLGATATRLDGRVRVVITVVEGDRAPRQPVVAARDAI